MAKNIALEVGVLGMLLVATPMLGSSSAAAQTSVSTPMRGIPGAHNVDHVGLTVPDLDQAVRFFVDVLGAEDLFGFDEGPGTANPADLHATFDVDPRSTLRVRMLRLGPTLNVELMEYRTPGQNRTIPRNSDVDVPHIAFFVDDIGVATAYLAAHGCTLLSGPLKSSSGPKAGQAIRYFKTPWGSSMEVLSRPKHMPYETQTPSQLFGPVPSWSSR